MTNGSDDDLTLAFAAARCDAARPAPEALLARIEADAAAFLPRPRPEPSVWRRFADALGGWPALGGLATAGVAGFWLGYAPPEAAADLGAALSGGEWFGGGLDLLFPEYTLDTGEEG
jgi:hypothetical protein